MTSKVSDRPFTEADAADASAILNTLGEACSGKPFPVAAYGIGTAIAVLARHKPELCMSFMQLVNSSMTHELQRHAGVDATEETHGHA